MFTWNSEDRKERFTQIREVFKQINFRVILDDNVKVYGVDKKHKQIFLSEKVIESKNCEIVDDMIKSIGGKKFAQEFDQGK